MKIHGELHVTILHTDGIAQDHTLLNSMLEDKLIDVLTEYLANANFTAMLEMERNKIKTL